MRARRSEIDDAENGAVARRRHTDRCLRAVRRAGGVHRKFACDPEQGYAVGAALLRASWPVTIRRVDRISIAVSSRFNPLAVAARIRQSCFSLCQAQTRMTGN